MNISGISATDSPYSANAVQGNSDLDKGAFMKLLVTQLKNQDPLEPTNNEEFVAQLANFSSLEQMEQLNENVISMVLLNQSNALMDQLTSSSALIGQNVRYDEPSIGTSLSGVVTSVKVTDGAAILNIDGNDIPLTSVTEVLGTN